MEIWSTVESIGIFGTAAVVLAYSARRVVEHYLEKDLERHKADTASVSARKLEEHRQEMQASHDLALEKLRAELRLMEAERLGRLRILQERQGDMLDQLYKKIVLAQRAMDDATKLLESTNEPSTSERLVTAAKLGNDFLQFYDLNDIYLDDDAMSLVDSLREAIREAFHEMAIAVDSEQRGWHDERKPSYERRKAAWETMQNRVPPARRAIREEFRQLIGASSSWGCGAPNEGPSEDETLSRASRRDAS